MWRRAPPPSYVPIINPRKHIAALYVIKGSLGNSFTLGEHLGEQGEHRAIIDRSRGV